MTEAEWLECAEPEEMLQFLRGKASDRKLRLLVCACLRSVWHLLRDPSRKAVEVGEQFASDKHREDARQAARRFYRSLLNSQSPGPTFEEQHAAIVAPLSCWPPSDLDRVTDGFINHVRQAVDSAGTSHLCSIVHDIFGNPFRAIAIDTSWLACKSRQAVELARHIHDNREFDRLPLLADALEDAGFTDPELLGHLRSPGPHVRRCWAVDLVLQRS